MRVSLPAGDNPGRLHRLIVVEDPDLGPVPVWWHVDRSMTWRCKVHGRARRPTCEHMRAAAGLLDWPALEARIR